MTDKPAPEIGNGPRAQVRLSRRALGIGAIAAGGAALGLQQASRSPRVSTTRSRRVQGAESGQLTAAFVDDELARIRPLLASFEDEHDVVLDVRSAPALELFEQYTIDLLQQTAVIDVASLRHEWLPHFTSQPVLSELDDLIEGENPVAPVSAARLLGETPNDAFVAMPWCMDLTIAAYSGDALQADLPPGTWDAWDALANGVRGEVLVAAEPAESAAVLFRAVMAGLGQPVIRLIDREPQLYTELARDAAERIARLAQQSSVPALQTGQEDLAGLRSALPASCPVCWASAWFQAGRPPEWRLALSPGIGLTTGSSLLKGSLLVIPDASPAKVLASAFVRWLLSPRIQAQLAQAGLIPVARHVVYGLADDGTPHVPPAIRQALARPVIRPHLRAFQQVEVILGVLVENVIQGSVDVRRALGDAQYAIRQALRQEGEL